MGQKKVCLDCRKAFNISNNIDNYVLICPQCNKESIELSHLFQPPKMNDIKKWEVVKFLIDNGCRFNHIREVNFTDKNESYGNYIKYPVSIKEAIEFVRLYKEQF